jgi:TrmH family RNA methyltransferase
VTIRIESLDNPRVKEVVRLRERRARRKSGRFLVEGRRELERALAGGHRPETLFVQPDLVGADGLAERAVASGARRFDVSPAVYARMAVRQDEEGMLAVFPIPEADADRLVLPEGALVLVAVGIEKPGNLGALLRSADGFGVDAFVVCGGTDLWNPNVIRASVGCVFTVPVGELGEEELLAWLGRRGLPLAAATPDGTVAPSEAPFRNACAIVVGSEEDGLPAGILAGADVRLRIPMQGMADSLNVSVAAAVLLYEAARQRGFPPE